MRKYSVTKSVNMYKNYAYTINVYRYTYCMF